MPTGHGTRFLILGLAVITASPAAAEIVHLTNGRTLSVRGHATAGDKIRLLLRGGGELTCPRSIVASVTPDEVPHPDPASPTVERAASGAAKGGGYREIIDDAAARHQLDARLLHAVIRVESNYRPRARSERGALGLMQLMPATARQYKVSDPFDPVENVDAGARHLRGLLDRFELSLALAAYNAGEAAIARFGGMPPYAETRTYVRRVLALVGG